MQQVHTETVNRDHEPNEFEIEVLEFISDEPCPRVTPLYLRENTPLDKGRVEYALGELTTAGWMRRLCPGFYELVNDPRKDS